MSGFVDVFAPEDIEVRYLADGFDLYLREDGSTLATARFRGASWNVETFYGAPGLSSSIFGVETSSARLAKILSRDAVRSLNVSMEPVRVGEDEQTARDIVVLWLVIGGLAAVIVVLLLWQ